MKEVREQDKHHMWGKHMVFIQKQMDKQNRPIDKDNKLMVAKEEGYGEWLK